MTTRKREQAAQQRRSRLSVTRQRVSDAVREATRQQHEREKAQVLERAEEMVEEGRERRQSLGVNRDAALTGGSYAGYSERLGGGRDPEDEGLPNSAPTYGALGRRRRKRPGLGRPPYC